MMAGGRGTREVTGPAEALLGRLQSRQKVQALQVAMAALCFSVGTSGLCEFPLPLRTEPNAIFQLRGADICGVCGFAMASC